MGKRWIRWAVPALLLLLLPAVALGLAAPERLELRRSGLSLVSDRELPYLYPDPVGAEVLYLTVGRSVELKVRALPEGRGSGFSVVSSDEAIISAEGTRLKGKSRGVCQITLISTLDPAVTLTVNAAVGKAVEKVCLHHSQSYYVIGNSYRFSVDVLPEDADCRGVRYTGSDSKVFTVSDEGVVTALSSGLETLSVKAADGSGAEDKCRLRVVRLAESISLSEEEITLGVGSRKRLRAEVLPKRSYGSETSWYSSNEQVVTVENGNLEALSPGTAVITVQAGAEKELVATARVTVVLVPEKIMAYYDSVQLMIGESLYLGVEVQPSEAEIQYSFTREGIAEIDDYGTLTALEAGSTELTVSGLWGGALLTIPIRVCNIDYEPLDYNRIKDGKRFAETFVYELSKMGRGLYVTRIGEQHAPNRILMQFCVHGYEGVYVRDGLLLTEIAQELILALGEDMPEGWEVYIIPCGNPDGLISGNSSRGFGRCNAEGLDINRDFSVNWQYREDARNRTGEEPFSTREAQALRDFALWVQPTVTIDVHGYINCVYGESDAARIMAEALQLKQHKESAGGMFFSWAQEEFGNALLIELPEPDRTRTRSYREQWAEKLETALRQLMASPEITASSSEP